MNINQLKFGTLTILEMAPILLKFVLFTAIAMTQLPLSFGKVAKPTHLESNSDQPRDPFSSPPFLPQGPVSKHFQFHLDLYQWLLTSKYEILSKDNEYASPEHVLLFLVPRIGLQASSMLVKNCMKQALTYQESALHFGICALVVLDEVFQKKSLH